MSKKGFWPPACGMELCVNRRGQAILYKSDKSWRGPDHNEYCLPLQTEKRDTKDSP